MRSRCLSILNPFSKNMTSEQYQWLKDNGYDPAVYDVDADGNIFENPVAAAKPTKKMSPLRAAGTSFAGSILPTAGSLGASAPLAGLAAANPLVGIPLMIGAGLVGGYGTGKLQEAALERFAPEAQQELLRAQTDQPVASFAGGFAPSALAFRPDFKGVAGLTAPIMSFTPKARAAFVPAAVNVGANVAGAGAGELLNVSEGGEFSAPRFAANVALGSLFSRPTALGRKMGFPDLAPEVAAPERTVDVDAARAAQAEAAARQAEIEGVPIEKRHLFETKSEMDWWMKPEGARMDDIKAAAKSVKARLPKGRLAEMAASPEIFDVVQNPAKFPDFLANMAEQALEGAHEAGRGERGYRGRDILTPEEAQRQREWSGVREQEAAQRLTPEYLAQAMGAGRERAGAFTPEGGVRVAPADWTPTSERITRQPATTEEVLGRPSEAREGASLEEAIKPTPEEIAKAEQIQAENARLEAEQNAAELRKLQDLEAAQALTEESKARLEALQAKASFGESLAPERAGEVAQAKQELADARVIAEDLYARLQRKAAAGEPITQADVDAAAALAARRGLKLAPATPDQQAKGVRGAYIVDKDGNRVIYIDPLAATRDTAIHEIGHDVFSESANERMQRSLMQTAEDSPVFRDSYEAFLAEGKSPQEARDLALEEGVIQAFGEKYPSVKPGEIRRWFNALKASLKSMVGMKLSPEDAVAWLHYATTEAVPWKGVAVGKTGGQETLAKERYQRAQTETPETLAKERYQRGIVGEANDAAKRFLKFSEIDNLEARGGIHAVVAKAMRAFYSTNSYMRGQAAAHRKIIDSLSPERREMLGKHIGQEFDQQRFITPPSEIAQAYREYRQEWQKFWPTEANKAGHTIRAAGGPRARLEDPYYGPFHMWSDKVRDIITTKQGSPEYVKLKDDYIKQHERIHQQNGMSLPEAQTRAVADFNDAIREMSVPYDPTATATFAGARKAQGIPLPESWREYDMLKLLDNYDRRSAMDYAMQEHMEKSPQVMAALGSDTFFNDQPIPAQIKAATPYIGDDNSVKSILREMSGKPARRPDELASGASRAIGATTIGTISKATEVPTTMIAGLRYLSGSDYLPGTLKFIEKLADWAALKERSYASGLNKREGAQNMRQIAGVAENASGYLNKFAEGFSTVTGLNKLEQAARTLAQGWGEVLVQINKHKAATGDKDAIRVLDTLSPDWRTRSDANLAAEFGKLMQGSYDMTQLPAWMLESGAAPYLTWSKWSAGQYNNFVKFAIEPALQGNVKPLLGHLLIGIFGGAAVDQIREWMNNREGRDVNWDELQSWMDQNQGQLGAEGMKQLAVKLLNLTQSVGTFGIAGDIAKMVTTAAVGGTAQGMATAPVANFVFDTTKKAAAALKAIDDGEDFGLVLRQAAEDVAKSHIQVVRVWQNWNDEQENLRYDDRRQRRLFDELTGAPTQAGTFSVSYGNLGEREFERKPIGEKTGEEAMSLVRRAREQATTPEDYASRIRKLKTSQNQIMPSMERQPMKAARYLSWLEGTAEGKGGETMRRYMIRQSEDKYRKSLIEGLSGLR